MIQMAQDMFKVVQDHIRNTLHAVADLVESVGAPAPVTTFIQSLERFTGGNNDHGTITYTAPPPAPPAPTPAATTLTEQPSPFVELRDEPKKKVGKRRQLPDGIRALVVEDAINGSTYLARIIWSLGVAEREGKGALRPADMARMIMGRSPISLEPPNVARYIRRSKPTCVAVDRTEGSSNFYKLNAEGKSLFEEKFGTK
jgi:hypothetical protein